MKKQSLCGLKTRIFHRQSRREVIFGCWPARASSRGGPAVGDQTLVSTARCHPPVCGPRGHLSAVLAGSCCSWGYLFDWKSWVAPRKNISPLVLFTFFCTVVLLSICILLHMFGLMQTMWGSFIVLNVSYAWGIKYSDPRMKCQRSCTVLLSSKEGLLYSLFPFWFSVACTKISSNTTLSAASS